MTKIKNLSIALFAGLIIAGLGCAHDDGPQQPAIPAHLNFSPMSGPALTEADKEGLKKFFASYDSKPASQYLIQGTSYENRIQQNKNRANVSSEYNQALNNMTNKCEIHQRESTPFNFKEGQTRGQSLDKASIGGDQCPEEYSFAFQTDVNADGLDQKTGNGDVHANVLFNLSDAIKDQKLQKLSNFVSVQVVAKGDFLLHVVNGNYQAFGKASGSANLATLTADVPLSANFSSEFLGGKDTGEVVFHARVSGYIKDLNFSFHGKSAGKDKTNLVVYLNGTPLPGSLIKSMMDSQKTVDSSHITVESDESITIDSNLAMQSMN